MLRILTLIICILWLGATHAQTSQYVYPVRDVAGHCVANFGEIRPGHFHAGVDIRTDGVEGKPCVAVADGYVSRIVVGTSGYGLGLYLTLTDGTEVVYGHLQRFREDIDRYAVEEQTRLKTNYLDREFPPEKWAVKAGDIVGYSGNTGSSMGPHLHFEMRRPKTGIRRNLVREGIIPVVDTIPPRILRVHYVEVDTLPTGVVCRSKMRSRDVLRYASGGYRLVGGDTLAVGRKGYFIVEVSDRRNGVNNRFGIWRLTAMRDDLPYFQYRMDGFTYAEGRMSDAVSCYPMQRKARTECIRVARMERAPEDFYPFAKERGVVRCPEGEVHRIGFVVDDDSGNTSFLEFAIKGQVGESFHGEEPAEDVIVIDPDEDADLAIGAWATCHIPSGSLYEKTAVQTAQKEVAIPKNRTGIRVLSPAVLFVGEDIPMLHAASYRLQHPVPEELASRTLMARATRKGLSAVGGRYTEGAVTEKTRTAGWMLLVADTEAPKIFTRYPKARRAGVPDLSRAAILRFKVTDNFAGIADHAIEIDGQWVPANRQPIRGEITHRFSMKPQGKVHSVRVRVTDRVGNVKTYTGEFFR